MLLIRNAQLRLISNDITYFRSIFPIFIFRIRFYCIPRQNMHIYCIRMFDLSRSSFCFRRRRHASSAIDILTCVCVRVLAV